MFREFQSVVIFAICLLAFTGVVFFVKYENERAQTRVLEARSIENANKVVVIEKEVRAANQRSVQANRRAAENARKAAEARVMLEQARQKSKMTQNEIVAALNAQLEREADARISAEKASAELAKERDRLALAVEQTKTALRDFDAAGKSGKKFESEISRIKRALHDRESEIEQLKLRQAELEQLNREAREAQLRIESEMSAKHYKITLPKSKRLIFPITKFRN